MFTNGMFLSQQARVLRESGLDSVYVSIDASAPETHDKLRGKKGLFAEAMKSIQIALDEGFSVGISACLSPETYAKGELHAMAKLAKQVGVHELLVFDAMPTGRFRNRTDLVDNEGWVEEMIQESRIYNKDPSFPVGVLLYPYATSHASVGCSCGTSYFYVSPYGDVMSCDFNHAKFGNINTEKLYSIWGRMSSSEGFSCAKWGGCKIKSSEFRAKPTVCPGNCHS
jgi:MoaA/NifB/PqqE/SkfB family radical SAM enzyme